MVEANSICKRNSFHIHSISEPIALNYQNHFSVSRIEATLGIATSCQRLGSSLPDTIGLQ